MKAETVYNVFQELSPDEKKRFFNLCGVDMPKAEKSKKKRPIVTDEEATETLLKRIQRAK